MRPLSKEKIAGGGAKGPEENSCGPVLVKIEDLPGEENGGAENGCANSVARKAAATWKIVTMKRTRVKRYVGERLAQ